MTLGVGAAVDDGIVHDQTSVRISPSYLMDWHPPIVASREPSVVALAWGVVATWWFGLILGGVLAFSATVGRRSPAPWRWIVAATGSVLALSATAASIAFGITHGFGLEMPDLLGPVYSDLSRPQRLRSTQTLAMHETSYDAAAIAALVAAGWIAWRRTLSKADGRT